MRRVCFLLAVCCLLLSGAVAFGGPAFASDPSCGTGAPNSTDAGKGLSASGSAAPTGIRAPIQLRIDGDVCYVPPGDTNEEGFAASWIGIQDNGGDLVQIGYIHIYDASIGGGEYCRFYAYLLGNVVQDYEEYDCSDSDDNFDYFLIKSTGGPEYNYHILDCNSNAGYSGCDLKLSGASQFTGTISAEVEEEADYTCTVHFMGDSADKVNVGETSYNIQEQSNHDDSSWTSNTWNKESDPDCSSGNTNYYEDNFGTGIIKYWDSRNSS